MNDRQFRTRIANLVERKRNEAEVEAVKIQKKPPATQKPRAQKNSEVKRRR